MQIKYKTNILALLSFIFSINANDDNHVEDPKQNEQLENIQNLGGDMFDSNLTKTETDKIDKLKNRIQQIIDKIEKLTNKKINKIHLHTNLNNTKLKEHLLKEIVSPKDRDQLYRSKHNDPHSNSQLFDKIYRKYPHFKEFYNKFECWVSREFGCREIHFSSDFIPAYTLDNKTNATLITLYKQLKEESKKLFNQLLRHAINDFKTQKKGPHND